MQESVDRIRSLGSAPRELKLVYVLKLLESFADFSTALNLVLYLTQEFGMSDAAAGTMYGAWGVATSLFGMAFGAVIDRVGIRSSLLVGGSLLVVGRVMLAWAPTRAHALASILIVQPAGQALAIPVLSIAIRRTTDESSRAVAFATFYAVMNIGALISGMSTDAINRSLTASVGATGAMRALFWIGAAASLLYTLIVYFSFRDIAARKLLNEEDGEAVAPSTSHSTWQTIVETWKDRVFWRLCAFYGIMFGARSIFRHIDLTLPKYMQRTISKDADYGLIYSINPLIVVLTVTLVQARIANRDPYDTVVSGTVVTTLAPLVLAVLSPSYASAVLFMIVLSAGEVWHASKIMEFGMMLAPEGREGVYSTLVGIPLFAVRLVAGAASGGLLGAYCPATGERHCQLMWFFITCISASTPLTLYAFRRFIYTDDVRQRIEDARQRQRDVQVAQLLDEFDDDCAVVVDNDT